MNSSPYSNVAEIRVKYMRTLLGDGIDKRSAVAPENETIKYNFFRELNIYLSNHVTEQKLDK